MFQIYSKTFNFFSTHQPLSHMYSLPSYCCCPPPSRQTYTIHTYGRTVIFPSETHIVIFPSAQTIFPSNLSHQTNSISCLIETHTKFSGNKPSTSLVWYKFWLHYFYIVKVVIYIFSLFICLSQLYTTKLSCTLSLNGYTARSSMIQIGYSIQRELSQMIN